MVLLVVSCVSYKLRQFLEKFTKNLLKLTKKAVFTKMVCFTITDHGVKRKVIVIPKPLRAKILQIAHNRSGHFGISNTCSLMLRQFSWPLSSICQNLRSILQDLSD